MSDKSNFNDMDKLTTEIADMFFTESCGYLHLKWMQEKYWAKVCKKIIIPALIRIHDKLVDKNITEDNKFSLTFADDTYCFIPTKSEDRKVIYHTLQSYNLLYVIDKRFGNYSLHIRQVFDKWGPRWEDDDVEEQAKEYLKDIQSAINASEELSEYSDDSSEYPKRRSLDFYKSFDFNIDSNKVYGHLRDGGYVASLDVLMGTCKVGANTASLLELIMTCHIHVMARELEVDTDGLEEFERD